jgi:hypothetical protein
MTPTGKPTFASSPMPASHQRSLCSQVTKTVASSQPVPEAPGQLLIRGHSAVR